MLKPQICSIFENLVKIIILYYLFNFVFGNLQRGGGSTPDPHATTSLISLLPDQSGSPLHPVPCRQPRMKTGGMEDSPPPNSGKVSQGRVLAGMVPGVRGGEKHKEKTFRKNFPIFTEKIGIFF